MSSRRREAWQLARTTQPEEQKTLVKLQEQAAAVPERCYSGGLQRPVSCFSCKLGRVPAKAGRCIAAARLMEAFKSLVTATAVLEELCQQLKEDARAVIWQLVL